MLGQPAPGRTTPERLRHTFVFMETTTPPTSAPLLECSALTKSYGDRLAVNRLDFSVERGEIFGIVGSNGAGKTTTVECAQGLRRPDAGSIRVLGLDPIRDRARLRSRVGSQLQESALPDRLRVGEAIALFANDRRLAQRTMDDWGLVPLASTPFGGLSGGQKQRLFLALALLNEPEIVFLDELTQGLDPSARTEVWTLIEQVRDRGTTVVLVTHFMDEAEALCDRVAVMSQGRLLDLDAPAALIGRHGGGIRIRFRADADVVEWLEQVPGVSSTAHARGEVEVRGDAASLVRVGAALVDRDCVPDDLRVSQPSLEGALVALLDAPMAGVS